MKRVFRAGELPTNAQVLRVEDLRLPIHITLGALESASLEEINDLIADLTHERERR